MLPEVEVKLISEKQINPTVIERLFDVSLKGGERQRTRHLHFLGWPDHGLPIKHPEDFSTLLDNLVAFLRETATGETKAAVHCSAGIGRTGTLIALADMILTLTL